MDFIQIILLAVVTFIFAIDQYSLTEVIYRPIIACPIVGLILGNPTVGLVVGGTYELMMVGSMPVGGAQPPNSVIGGVVAMIFAIKSDFSVEEALGSSVIFALFGQYAVTLTFSFISVLMGKADQYAAKADTKGITRINFISMAFLGTLFALMAILAYVGGVSVSPMLKEFSDTYSWIMAGLGVAGGMMRYVGFAVLLKIMLANDMWGIYFAGFVLAALFGNVPATAGATLLSVALVGVAIAIYDFTVSCKISDMNQGGGMSDGI